MINQLDSISEFFHTSGCFGYQILLRVTIFDIDCGAEIRMTEPLLNLLERNAIGEKQTGAAVTEIVKADTAQSVFLQKIRESTGKILRSHTLAHFIHEHKAVILVVVTVAADFLVQLLCLFHLH